jgi:hypothetical protein
MKPSPENDLKLLTRRHFFRQAGFTIGSFALSSLLGAQDSRPRARSVIYLFMAGAPSHVDLFDHKPRLSELNGKEIPEELVKGERFAFIRGRPKVLASPFKFQKHGKSGAELSELLPHTAKIVDDIAIVRSMHTTQFNHAPAQIYMNSGHQVAGRPSMGSWLSYGLGSSNKDLPAFVVMVSGQGQPDGGKSCWGSGFLPTTHQGVEFRAKGDPVLFASNPPGTTPEMRRRTLDALGDLNRERLADVGDPEIATRIEAYELAYRMQTSVPELTDVSKEPKEVIELYGSSPFSRNCLLARRLVERGVRFVQLYHRGWDHHGAGSTDTIDKGLPQLCRETDRGAAALVQDLKRLGLLDTTLVVWGGEFGRTPMIEGRFGIPTMGRDHHARAFSMWLAGGGIRPGISLGRTDDFGYNIVEDPVDVHDLHATALHLLGIDHTKLTYRFQGRDFRLTDVHGRVIKKLLV